MVESTKVAAVILETEEMNSRYRRKMQSVFRFLPWVYTRDRENMIFWSISNLFHQPHSLPPFVRLSFHVMMTTRVCQASRSAHQLLM